MTLTPEQLQTIRNCAKDEAAFDTLVTLIDEINTLPEQKTLSHAASKLNMTVEHVRLLQSILDAIPEIVYIKDLESRFVLMNRYAYEAEGFDSQDALIGKTDFDIEPTSAQHYYDTEQQLMKSGQSLIDFEDHMSHADGTIHWFTITKAPLLDANGNVVGLIGINRDITERKLAQTALDDERNLLRTIIDHIPDKIYIKDKDSRFRLVNARTWKDTRYFYGETGLSSLDEIIGKTDFEFMSPDRAKRLFDEEQEIMRTGEAIINQDYFLPKSHLGARWFLVTKVPVYDDNGDVIGIVGINRDVTEHKHARQKELELTLEKERSAILADFITKATHEFRTAVTVLESSAYLLQKSPDAEKREVYVSRIVERVKSLLTLVNELITMSRLDRTNQLDLKTKQVNNLLKILQERYSLQNSDDKAHVEFILNEHLPSVQINEENLDIALTCLISNAIAHTPKHGKITVHPCLEKDSVIIEVVDTGIGMDDEVQENIFKRFYRANDAHTTSGFGLGLPIVQRIVELHHGTIEAKSEPDKGSTFRILLPCDQKA